MCTEYTYRSRLTKNDNRHPTAHLHLHRHRAPFPVVARRASSVRDARFRSIRSTPRTRARARHPSHRLLFDVARPRRRARARRARKPRASTDATDRRRRPTTTRAKRMSRYGRKGVDTVRARVSTRSIDQSARAATPPRVARVRLVRQRQQRPRRNTASCRCDTRLFGCLKKTHLGGARARAATRRMFSARRYPCDA